VLGVVIANYLISVRLTSNEPAMISDVLGVVIANYLIPAVLIRVKRIK
jgi:hypothetical protein